ncbi:MAG TPA: hypothetical protein VH601_03575 [Bryobacteraceae bacterium]|jgi:hypothetical protein
MAVVNAARATGSLLLLVASIANAAELQKETLRAWDEYVQTTIDGMQERLRPGGHFLWTNERPERGMKVRNGEILVSAGQHNPKRVTCGLIHHWIAAAFIPNTSIRDVLAVTRDYARYKDFYSPAVISSKPVRREGPDDRFSMLLMNKAFLLKAALDGEYESTYFPVDTRRCYSITRSVRVQEIQGYGGPDEHKLVQDQGSGFIWRLASISRFEERDGGVYIELEAMGLSRDIPVSLRWLVDPIVRRVSRDSLTISLRQTGNAVRSSTELAMSAERHRAEQRGQ